MISNLRTGFAYALNPKNIIKELIDWTKFEWALLATLLTVQTGAFIIGSDYSIMGWIGLLTGIATILSLVLVNKGRLTNYVWGFLGSVTWFIVAIHNWLIGDMFSQAFYVVMQIVGLYTWARLLSKSSKDTVSARKMKPLQGVLSIIGTIAIYAIVVTVSIHADGNQIWLDGTLLPLGIAGQTLMTFGYRSQWFAWIALDIVNVVIWFNQLQSGGVAAVSMLVLQIVMLLNAFYGAYCWFKSSNDTPKVSTND
jgi:nicotinamide mononucleotide transporter